MPRTFDVSALFRSHDIPIIPTWPGEWGLALSLWKGHPNQRTQIGFGAASRSALTAGTCFKTRALHDSARKSAKQRDVGMWGPSSLAIMIQQDDHDMRKQLRSWMPFSRANHGEMRFACCRTYLWQGQLLLILRHVWRCRSLKASTRQDEARFGLL